MAERKKRRWLLPISSIHEDVQRKCSSIRYCEEPDSIGMHVAVFVCSKSKQNPQFLRRIHQYAKVGVYSRLNFHIYSGSRQGAILYTIATVVATDFLRDPRLEMTLFLRVLLLALFVLLKCGSGISICPKSGSKHFGSTLGVGL